MRQEFSGQKGDKALVALGANVASHAGNSRQTVEAAIAALRELFVDIVVSDLYQTPGFPAGSGPDFVNAACAFHCNMPAEDLLHVLHEIEATFGRTRALRWGQRTLDLDLIAVGDEIHPDLKTHDHWRTLPLDLQLVDAPDELILPHPRVQDRAFVLVPLCDVAPDWTHPRLLQTVTQMHAALPETAKADIVRL